MTFREKVLYHQIHPLKLAADISAGIASTWLLWLHEPWLAMPAAFTPAVAVSAAMLRWMAFDRQRDSAFGRYVARHMTRLAEGVRFGGQVVAWVGAWHHLAWVIAAGLAATVLGWTWSLPGWWSRAPERVAAVPLPQSDAPA